MLPNPKTVKLNGKKSTGVKEVIILNVNNIEFEINLKMLQTQNLFQKIHFIQ